MSRVAPPGNARSLTVPFLLPMLVNNEPLTSVSYLISFLEGQCYFPLVSVTCKTSRNDCKTSLILVLMTKKKLSDSNYLKKVVPDVLYL